MAKSDKLYSNSPSVGRDHSTGKVTVKRPVANSGAHDDAGGPKPADAEDMGLEGEASSPGKPEEAKVDMEHIHAHERHEMHHKHVAEHLQMHRRHEHEHALAGKTDKKILHQKHEAEHKEMHERQHEELKTMHRRHEKAFGNEGKEASTEKTGGEDIHKVEHDKKE